MWSIGDGNIEACTEICVLHGHHALSGKTMASPASKFVGEGFENHGTPVQKGIGFGILQNHVQIRRGPLTLCLYSKSIPPPNHSATSTKTLCIGSSVPSDKPLDFF